MMYYACVANPALRLKMYRHNLGRALEVIGRDATNVDTSRVTGCDRPSKTPRVLL